jgi:hypothetical protein
MDFVWIFSFQNEPFINAYTLMGAFWEHQNPKIPKPFRNELLKLLSRPWTKGSSILQKTLDLDLTILVKTKNWPTLVVILFHNIYLNMKNTCHGL